MPSSKTLTRYFNFSTTPGSVTPATASGGKAAKMVAAGISAISPPAKALMIRLKTTCTRASDSASIRHTAKTTGFIPKLQMKIQKDNRPLIRNPSAERKSARRANHGFQSCRAGGSLGDAGLSVAAFSPSAAAAVSISATRRASDLRGRMKPRGWRHMRRQTAR